jgi:hypothetical protein
VVSGAAHSGDRIEAGARVRATRPAEMWVGERVHLVLDGATALRYLDPHGVALEAGRLYVEVEGPYAFHVATPRGDVRVAGTIFEVDLTEGDLRVRVARGAVQVGTRRLAAGTRLAHGRIQAWPGHAGLWFDAPRLSLEAPPRVRRGEPLRLRLRLGTPGELPVPVAGPSASRRALWIEVQEPGGAVHEVVPSFDGRPFGLEPGARVTLRPDEPLPQEVRIGLPPGPGGTYRCRAMYRPEHEAPVISSGVGVEVVE